MSEQDTANMYPSPLHAPTVSPVIPPSSPTPLSLHPPGFFENLSRASSLSRIGSELPPLNSHCNTPYAPATPTLSLAHPTSTRSLRPPPIITNLPPQTPHPISPHNPPTVSVSYKAKPPQMREMSLLRWRTGHAVFFVGCLFVILGLCIGLIASKTTYCKVPYMAYSYYDNYVPYANMECTTHPSGWYAGAPMLAIGFMSMGVSWYFSWVKVQEMKMAAKYQVAFV